MTLRSAEQADDGTPPEYHLEVKVCNRWQRAKSEEPKVQREYKEYLDVLFQDIWEEHTEIDDTCPLSIKHYTPSGKQSIKIAFKVNCNYQDGDFTTAAYRFCDALFNVARRGNCAIGPSVQGIWGLNPIPSTRFGDAWMLALLKNILSGATCINFVMRMKSLSKYTLFPWMRRILEMATLFGDFSAAEAEDILESQPKLQKKGPSTDKDKEALYESMEIFTNKLKKYATGLDINQLDRTQAQKFDTGLFRHCMQALDIVLEFRGRHGRHQPKLQTRNLLVCLIPLLVGGFVWFFTPTYVITVPIALMALLGSVVVVSPLCVGAGLSVVAVGAYALYHLVSKERPKWNDVNVTMETYLLAIQKTMRVHHMLATFLKLPHGINEEENVKIRQQWIDEHEPRGRKSAMIPNDVEFPDAKNPEFLKILLEQFKIFVEKSGEKMELHLAEVKYEPKHQATDGNGNLSEKSNDSGKTPKS